MNAFAIKVEDFNPARYSREEAAAADRLEKQLRPHYTEAQWALVDSDDLSEARPFYRYFTKQMSDEEALEYKKTVIDPLNFSERGLELLYGTFWILRHTEFPF